MTCAASGPSAATVGITGEFSVDHRALVLVQKHKIVRSAAQQLDEMPDDRQARVTDGLP